MPIPMEELPPEVVACIFEQLPYSNNNWFHVMLACKRFLDIGRKIFDPSCDNNFAIRFASEYGLHRAVKILLRDRRVNPAAANDYAVRWASVGGHTEVVKE